MTTRVIPSGGTAAPSHIQKSQPEYSTSVLNGLLGLLDRPARRIDFVDLRAGTGAWTRMVCAKGVKSAIAVEPHDDLRKAGIKSSRGTIISWYNGHAHDTGLPDSSADLVSMASTLQSVELMATLAECRRILRPGGRFVALWNARLVDVHPLLAEIEAHLAASGPHITRISNGLPRMAACLTDNLWASDFFDDVVCLEGRIAVAMSSADYLNAWRAADDLRAQLGAQNFEAFVDFVEHRIKGIAKIEVPYLTRAWSARRID